LACVHRPVLTFAERLSLDHFVDSFFDFVDDFLAGLLGLADRLVGLSLLAELVVAGQRAGGFLSVRTRSRTTSRFRRRADFNPA
jgi:hypothetical protein